MRIHVLTTGGTIDKEYSLAGDLVVGSPVVATILERGGVAADVTYEPVCAKDSLDLDDTDRSLIVERVEASPARRVLVTHGTDTMVETASRLRRDQDRVVVLTGAMRPYRMRESDAPVNVGLALAALQVMSPGTYIAMSGRVFPADDVRKDHANGRFVGGRE